MITYLILVMAMMMITIYLHCPSQFQGTTLVRAFPTGSTDLTTALANHNASALIGPDLPACRPAKPNIEMVDAHMTAFRTLSFDSPAPASQAYLFELAWRIHSVI